MKIIVYPTDTVWGIGCDIYNEDLVKKIHFIKKSDETKPMSILFPSIDDLLDRLNGSFPFSKEWLERFFSLQSTLLIPKSFFKKEIPSWVLADSSFVSVRFLKNKAIDLIFSKLSSPIVSTSLNITGEKPIVEQGDALTFFKQYIAPQGDFFSNEESSLSGASSTIVKYENDHFVILREGHLVDDIKKLLKL